MRKLITILSLTLLTLTSVGQSQDYYYESYIYDAYKQEKENIIIIMVSSIGTGVITARDYHNGGDRLSIITSGFSFGISGYSIYRFFKLRKQIKEWERKGSKKVTE